MHTYVVVCGFLVCLFDLRALGKRREISLPCALFLTVFCCRCFLLDRSVGVPWPTGNFCGELLTKSPPSVSGIVVFLEFCFGWSFRWWLPC